MSSDKKSFYDLLKSKLDISNYTPKLIDKIEKVKLTTKKKEEYFVLKNEEKNTYIKLTPKDNFIVENIDGKTSVSDLVVNYFFKFQSFANERIYKLIKNLKNKYFLTEKPQNIYIDVVKKVLKRQWKIRLKILKNLFLGFKFELKNVDKPIGFLYNKFFHIFFSKPARRSYIILAIVGAFFFFFNLYSSRFHLFKVKDSYSIGYLFILIFNIIIVSVHELFHALAVKATGRKINAGGFLFYIGSPCFFVDTSDTWLTHTKNRIMVSWAGPYSTIIISSICSIVIFVFPDFFLADILFKLSFWSYVSAFFNLNPLLELDGYYMLIDHFEKPILRQRSMQFLKAQFFDKLKTKEKFSKEEKTYTFFGALAFAWTTFAIVMAVFVIKWRVLKIVRDIFERSELFPKVVSIIVLVLFILPVIVSMAVSLIFVLKYIIEYILELKVWRNNFYVAAAFVLFPFLVAFIVNNYSDLAYYSIITNSVNISMLVLSLFLLVILAIKLKGSSINMFLALFALFLLLNIAEKAVVLIGVNINIPFSAILTFTATIFIIVSLIALVKNISLYLRVPSIFLFLASIIFIISLKTEFAPELTKTFSYVYLFSTIFVLYIYFGRLSFLKASSKLASKSLVEQQNLKLFYNKLNNFLLENFNYFFGYSRLINAEKRFNKIMDKKNSGYRMWELEIVDEWPADDDILKFSNRCYESLTTIIDVLKKFTGINIIKNALINFYDNLDWKEREIANEYLLKKLPWKLDQTSDVYLFKPDTFYIFKKVPLFRELDEDKINTLSSFFKLEKYKKEKLIIRKGEIGDKFYIIKSGGAEVYDITESGDEKMLARLASGDFFGEIALLEDVPRTAFVRIIENTELLSLDKNTFSTQIAPFFKDMGKREEGSENQELVHKVPIFAEIPMGTLAEIAKKMQEKSFKAGEVIIKEGESGDVFYIIKEGKVEISKKGKPVAFLSKGEYFGEIALVKDIPRTATVKAATSVTVLILAKDLFLDLIDKKLVNTKELDLVVSRRMME